FFPILGVVGAASMQRLCDDFIVVALAKNGARCRALSKTSVLPSGAAPSPSGTPRPGAGMGRLSSARRRPPPALASSEQAERQLRQLVGLSQDGDARLGQDL